MTLPQYWLPRYDWVLSVEVLEHIPVDSEKEALDNIDRAAGHGVVLSWAVPGQLGFRHINNRPPTYVHKLMSERGFTIDLNASNALREKATFLNLKRNLMVFVRIKQ